MILLYLNHVFILLLSLLLSLFHFIVFLPPFLFPSSLFINFSLSHYLNVPHPPLSYLFFLLVFLYSPSCHICPFPSLLPTFLPLPFLLITFHSLPPTFLSFTLSLPLLLLQVRLLYCSLEEAELVFRAAWAAGQAGPSHMWFAVGPALSGLGLEGLPKALFAIRPQGWRDEPRRYEQSIRPLIFKGSLTIITGNHLRPFKILIWRFFFNFHG